MVEVLVLAVLLIVGAILITLLKALIFYLPAIVLAIVVLWVTHSLYGVELLSARWPSSAF